MPEGDGADELVSGAARVLVTGAGAVLENSARRRERDARQRAEEDRDAAAADRARTAALRDVDRVDLHRRDDVTAVAVLRADDRRLAEDDALPPLRPLEPEVTEARDVAGRNQARPPAEAVLEPVAAAKARSPRARGRGRAPERGRDR